MKPTSLFVLVAFAATSAFAWNPFAPKVTYERIVPAAHNLGPVKKLALIEVKGPHDEVQTYSKSLVAWIAGEKYFQFADARATSPSPSQIEKNASARAEFRKKYDSEVLLAVELSGCSSRQQSRVDTEKDKDGNKVKVTKFWVTADCGGTARLLDANDGREIASFAVRGEDKSYPSSSVLPYIEEGIVNGALAEMASRTQRAFTPRQEKEGIVLEKKTPAFKEAMARIKKGQLQEARQLWESQLGASASVAPLQYNLGAVSEALGDSANARKYYEAAAAAAPGEERYRKALLTLDQRLKEAEALKRRP